jgi:hypothetical protein
VFCKTWGREARQGWSSTSSVKRTKVRRWADQNDS